MSLPDDLKHYHSRRRWHDGLPFLAGCIGAAATGYLAVLAVMSLA